MRRTKEEALATRSRILDAAERTFAARGVSRTSLHDIAEAAGVTRGAVYWHFAGKADLFDAMLARVTLPMEMAAVGVDATATEPIASLRARFLAPLRTLARDARARRVFEIALLKVEYTGELASLRERRRDACSAWLVAMERALRAAARHAPHGHRIPARTAALGLLALAEGLIAHWTADPRAFDLVRTGTQVLDRYLDGLVAEPAARRRSVRRPALQHPAAQRGTL